MVVKVVYDGDFSSEQNKYFQIDDFDFFALRDSEKLLPVIRVDSDTYLHRAVQCKKSQKRK